MMNLEQGMSKAQVQSSVSFMIGTSLLDIGDSLCWEDTAGQPGQARRKVEGQARGKGGKPWIRYS